MDKYKKILIPSLYVGVIGLMIGCSTVILNAIKNYVSVDENYKFTIDNVFDGDIVPVMKSENDSIVRPYISDSVKIGRYFYDYESETEKQESSIISYENVYMQNTGVDYVDDEEFEIVSILDGEIIGIEDNEIYGKIITIKHGDNLITRYCNVNNVLVSVGYKVSQGEIIASSNSSVFDNNEMLHFEVIYKGNIIDPENLYSIKISELDLN